MSHPCRGDSSSGYPKKFVREHEARGVSFWERVYNISDSYQQKARVSTGFFELTIWKHGEITGNFDPPVILCRGTGAGEGRWLFRFSSSDQTVTIVVKVIVISWHWSDTWSESGNRSGSPQSLHHKQHYKARTLCSFFQYLI